MATSKPAQTASTPATTATTPATNSSSSTSAFVEPLLAPSKSANKRLYTRLDFNTEQEEQLIEFVRENQALYNPINSLYKNKNYRDHLWVEFGGKIGKSGKYSCSSHIKI